MKIGMNGSIVPAEEAVISVSDHGFLYGMGCFETFRAYNGHFFLLQEHLERLRQGLTMLDIEFKLSDQEIFAHLKNLLLENGLTDAYLRLSVSAGVEPLGLSVAPYKRPNWFVHVKPLPLLPDELYEKGKGITILKTIRNTPETPVRLKSFHYANNVLGKKELGANPNEGIFLTADGFLAEGIVSNLFWIIQGRLFTPSLDTGILPGITRAHVMNLAAQQSMQVIEGRFPLDALLEADEAFLTNSIQEIVPVARMEGHPFSVGRVGEHTEKLIRAYRKSICSHLA